MKIIVFQDIHGNIDVLNKLCETEDYKTADVKIFLGDIVGLGPENKECVDKLKTMDSINLMGNHDYWIGDHMGRYELNKCDLEKILHEQYCRNQLTSADREFLKSFKKDHVIEAYGKKLYFTHFIWQSEEDTIHANTRDKQGLLEVFKDYNYDYIIYGHEHDPHIAIGKDKTLVCFGCTGIIYPGYYGVISIDESGVKMEQKTLQFDLKALKEKIDNLKYPFYYKFINFYEYSKFMIDINDELKNVK